MFSQIEPVQAGREITADGILSAGSIVFLDNHIQPTAQGVGTPQ
jgi:hypothetical protein